MVPTPVPGCAAHSGLSDDELYQLALTDERQWGAILARLRPLLLRIARRRLPDLADDLHEEFIQEVWVGILEESQRGGGGRLFHVVLNGAVSSAINRIRSAYRQPGKRSRDRSTSRSSVPLEAALTAPDEAADREVNRLEAKLTLQRYLATADPRSRKMVALMIGEDLNCAEAARRAEVPRTTLVRALHALRPYRRSAA